MFSHWSWHCYRKERGFGPRWLVQLGILEAESVECIVYGLSEDVLFKQVCADVSSIQISDFTSWPDLLETEDPRTRDVGILFSLDHDDQTGVYRNREVGHVCTFVHHSLHEAHGVPV